MNAVVPIVIPSNGINLSPEFCQLLSITLFVACLIYCLSNVISLIIYIIRRIKK